MPYSASKIGADAMALSFSFDFPVVVARPFNTYGLRRSAGRHCRHYFADRFRRAEAWRRLFGPTRGFTFVNG